MRAGAARTRPPTATASPRPAGLVGGASRASLSSASCNNQPASSATSSLTHVSAATLMRVSSGAHGRKLTQLLARRRLLGLTRALGKWSLAACSLAAKSKLRQAAKAAANELRTLRSSILTAAQPSLRDLSERSEARRRTHLLALARYLRACRTHSLGRALRCWAARALRGAASRVRSGMPRTRRRGCRRAW